MRRSAGRQRRCSRCCRRAIASPSWPWVARIGRIGRQLTAAAPAREPPSLTRFVVLSLLLHLLVLVWLREAGWYGAGREGSIGTARLEVQLPAGDAEVSIDHGVPAFPMLR